MINFWKDQNPPSDTSFIWSKLNNEDNSVGYYRYDDDNAKWVVIPCNQLKQFIINKTHESLIAAIMGDDTSGIDTFAEIVIELNKKVNQSDLGDYIGIKYGTTAYWDAQNYVPREREIIIYSDYKSEVINGQTVVTPGIKIGTGNAYVQDLRFVGQYEAELLMSHINNSAIHVTLADKQRWDHKLNVDDANEVVDGVLIFNRN